jgi:acyl-CoA reductase-like NAD-dependent aldehyde dehydrogenase
MPHPLPLGRLPSEPVTPEDSPASPVRREVESRDPRTGEVWRRWPHPPREQVFAATARARAAQAAWAARPLSFRRRVIQAFRALCFARRHEIAALIEREVGKLSSEALGADVMVTLDLARYFASIAPGVLRTRRERGASLAMLRKVIEIRRAPFGVIAVISPWNYPFMLAAGILIPALLSGNAVILKPSEYSTATGELLVELLQQAGVPVDVCQCLAGDALTGATLLESGIDKVFFTGSERGGRAVAAACGARMIPVNLELGGNDAAIVLADADPGRTARGLVWGRLYSAGQTCVAPKRIFVETPIYERLIAAFRAELQQVQVLRHGSEHVGPLVRPQQVAALLSQRDDAIARGAHAEVFTTPDSAPSASFAAPTLLLNTPADARVMHEEAFGPLLVVVRVQNAAEAVRLANDSAYGLSASVWSQNISAATAIASQLDAGTVLINDVVVNVGIPNLPHGGVKASGTGRSHGAEGLLECTQARTTVTDSVNWMPQPWWFTQRADQTPFLDGVATAGHAPTLWQRATGAWNALRYWPRRA